MELHLKMWFEGVVESGYFEEVTAFEFADDGEKSTLIFDGKELLLLSLDKSQKIINAIRESIKE